VFPYGVASGDVRHDEVVLWTRTEPGAEVAWWCAAEGGAEPSTGSATADPETGAVHVLVGGLDAGVAYRYGFARGDAGSDEGRFKTIPRDRAVRFAVACCAKYNSGYFSAYRAIADRDDIDFVLHLGDYIYEAADVPTGKQTPGAGIGRTMDPVGDCVTREDYDRRYAEYRRDPDLRALHARHAIIATIDDHELSDNAWSGGADEHHPATQGPWADRMRAALGAWSDWMPTLRRPVDGDPVWQRVDLGTAGRIVLCETRTGRSDPASPDGPGKSELGAAQRRALLETLGDGGPGWTIVALPSMLTTLAGADDDEEAAFALRRLKLEEADTDAVFHDLWGGFAWERDQVLTAVAASDRAVVLSGDVHFSAEHEVTVSAGRYAEWTVTSVTSPNLDDKMGWPRGAESRDYEAAMLRCLPDLRWCDLDSHGFLVVTADEQAASCEWWFVDAVRTPSDGVVMGHAVTLPSTPVGEGRV
jgi:alkaline phosphatase D